MLWRSPGMVAKLRTVDMSLGGARVYSDDRLKLGTKLQVELLAGAGSTVQVLARVVWVDELEAGAPARYDVGLEFLDVPEEMTSRLAAILQKDEDYKRQLEAPSPPDRVWEDEEDDEAAAGEDRPPTKPSGEAGGGEKKQ